MAAIGVVAAGSGARAVQLAVVYPPWISSAQALAQASADGLDLVGTGRYPFIVIVAQRPGQSSARRPAGALITLDADGFGGCFRASQQVSS